MQISCGSRSTLITCRDNTRMSLNWRILTLMDIQKILSFNANFDPIGHTRFKTFGQSTVRAELLDAGNIFIVCSLTVQFSLLQMLYSISCNEETVVFNSSKYGILHVVLKFTHYGSNVVPMYFFY